MKIAIVCEGRTEKTFQPHLQKFLETRIAGKMPKLQFDPHHGSIPTKKKLRNVVEKLLSTGKQPADAVIALTDVYPDFVDAEDAKTKMKEWVGKESRFYPHVALHDFEAWLLPYWDRIQKLAGKQSKPFGANPEEVNHNHPPAHRLKRMFEAGTCKDSYRKPRDAGHILREADLLISANACPELKAFLNTILMLCNCDKGQMIP